MVKVNPCFAAQKMLSLLAEKKQPEPEGEIQANTIQWLKHKRLLTEEGRLTNEGERITQGMVNKESIVLYLKEFV